MMQLIKQFHTEAHVMNFDIAFHVCWKLISEWSYGRKQVSHCWSFNLQINNGEDQNNICDDELKS